MASVPPGLVLLAPFAGIQSLWPPGSCPSAPAPAGSFMWGRVFGTFGNLSITFAFIEYRTAGTDRTTALNPPLDRNSPKHPPSVP